VIVSFISIACVRVLIPQYRFQNHRHKAPMTMGLLAILPRANTAPIMHFLEARMHSSAKKIRVLPPYRAAVDFLTTSFSCKPN
jgi:hypothetical protein